MKQLILVYLFLLTSLTYSQIDSVKHNLIPNIVDSVDFSVWEVYTKEMSIQGQEKQEYEKELARTSLSQEDQQLLIPTLRNSKSYDYTRALPYHYNLVFYTYYNGQISSEIRISTMTGNIDIDNRITGDYFMNNCSEELGQVLLELLDNNSFSKLFDEIDLEGITIYNKK